MSTDPLWPQLLLQAVLILVSAFFAATEIAILSLNETILNRQAEDGDKKAARLLCIVRAPTRFLSTIQVGITLAGFLSAAFAADHFARRITLVIGQGFTGLSQAAVHALAVIVITLILAFFTLIFGALVPKRVAMKQPDSVARMAIGMVGALSAVLGPIVWLLTVCSNGVLRLLRIDPNQMAEGISEAEIRMLVDIGGEKGTIEQGEKEMINNIFAFNNTAAEDVMIHRTDMVMIWLEDTADEIVEAIESSGLSRFPVYEEDADDIIGTLNTREYLLNCRKASPKPMKDLIRSAYFVPESVRADLLFRDMQSKKVHMAIVVDEYGGTSGLVTMEDLLEEIVGNIYDEFDPQAELLLVQLEENLWRVAGSADLEEVCKALGVEYPENEEYDTLGGLVFDQLSVIPEDGSQCEVDACGLHVRVENFTDRRVDWALVSRQSPPGEIAPSRDK